MKNLFIVMLMLIFSIPVTGKVFAQKDYERKLEKSRKLMDALAPGKEHQLLTVFAGKWRQLCEIPQTGGTPNNGKGQALGTIILGGRYVRISSELEFVPFGIASDITIGFDKLKDKFVFYSIDNLSTYPSIADGGFDSKTNTFTFKGVTYSDMQDGKVPFRIVIKFENKDKYTYKVFVGDGKDEALRQKIINLRID